MQQSRPTCASSVGGDGDTKNRVGCSIVNSAGLSLLRIFYKDELVARIQAIVRRSKGHAQSVINTGDLCVT
jgi:two-component system cell cycle response regulator CtrA